MELRLAHTSDLANIANLFLKCWKISYTEVLSQETRDAMTLASALELWEKALSTNLERKTLLAIENEELVGLFRVGSDPKDSRRGHLFSLYVSPDFAGMGYGKTLLEAAIAEVKAQGFDAMSLWVFDENKIAKSLYTKYGFVATGKNKTTPEWNALEIEMLNPQITLKS
jgi:ribosomal protein S18 acetylase RimI-like enzyme